MIGIEIAALFVSTISALSSVIQAVKAAKELSPQEVEEASTIEMIESNNRSVIALSQTSIDSEYIEIAQKNIERALRRFKDVWKDISVPQAVKDQELESANFVVCSELSRVKKLNSGHLPGDDRFHQLWAQHNCDNNE